MQSSMVRRDLFLALECHCGRRHYFTYIGTMSIPGANGNVVWKKCELSNNN